MCTENRQSAANNSLTKEQLQVLLTGKFGDGCFHIPKKNTKYNYNYGYSTSSIKMEYIQYKKALLGNLVPSEIKSNTNGGFSNKIIHKFTSKFCKDITNFATLALEDTLELMDELGLALWIYDDGSLHKTKHFYNLNTQKFSEEINKTILVPFLKRRFNITAVPTKEQKQNGKVYWYLRIGKFDGAFKISEILNKFYISEYSYKIICPETIQKWSKLQEKLKSAGIDSNSLTARKLSAELRKISI